MDLVGYGEDALTFHALTERLSEFLASLEDQSDSADAVVLFRPSFGRSGKASPFGEFDAIVGTVKAVYLVEAKWSRSAEAWQPTLSLRPEQLRRHQIFRWYLQRWREDRPTDWQAFAQPRTQTDFQSAFPGKGLPPSPSVLADSLEYTLGRLSSLGPIIQDVLLYCNIDDRPCPPPAEGFGFRVVDMVFKGAHRSGFFSMNPRNQGE